MNGRIRPYVRRCNWAYASERFNLPSLELLPHPVWELWPRFRFPRSMSRHLDSEGVVINEMDKIKLNPTKDAYDAIKADVDVPAAIKELFDNGIDNGLRQGRDEVTLALRYESDKGGSPVLVVEDDSGGLDPNELSMVFAIGQSEKENITRSIGAFGIGAKKALMCLGDEFTIRSRHVDADIGYEYTIGQQWLEDDDTWEVPIEEVMMEAGTTEIEIRELNFNWQNIRAVLKNDLANTYEPFLRGDADVTARILFPDGERTKQVPLSPPARTPYSYTPWDGFHPRRYEGIILDPDEVSSPVHMCVEVGLLVEGDDDEAGVDWVCQNRVVERGNRDGVSGFGNELPKFRESKQKRLKARVELQTGGDASEIPWNSDKSRIHERHAVTEAARDVLRKIIPAYMTAKYGTVEPAFLEPFTNGDQYASNGGKVDTVHLRGKFERKRRGDLKQIQITDKPDNSLPQISDMQETAKAHAQLGFKYEYLDWVEPSMRPTYSALVEHYRKRAGCFESLETLDRMPPDFTQDGRSGVAERDRLAELARQHVNQEVRYTGLSEWEEPRYELELKEAANDRNLSIDGLEPVDELPEPLKEHEDEGGEVETFRLSFGEFTESDLEVIESHLGELAALSPEKRKEKLVEHFQRLNIAGVRFEASAD